MTAVGFAHALAKGDEVGIEIDHGPFDRRSAAIFVAALVQRNPAALIGLCRSNLRPGQTCSRNKSHLERILFPTNARAPKGLVNHEARTSRRSSRGANEAPGYTGQHDSVKKLSQDRHTTAQARSHMGR